MNMLFHTRLTPVVLLGCSNVFMTVAWYGHLKHKSSPLWLAILASWGIAFFELRADGPGQPFRQPVLLGHPVEDHAGSDHP